MKSTRVSQTAASASAADASSTPFAARDALRRRSRGGIQRQPPQRCRTEGDALYAPRGELSSAITETRSSRPSTRMNSLWSLRWFAPAHHRFRRSRAGAQDTSASAPVVAQRAWPNLRGNQSAVHAIEQSRVDGVSLRAGPDDLALRPPQCVLFHGNRTLSASSGRCGSLSRNWRAWQVCN